MNDAERYKKALRELWGMYFDYFYDTQPYDNKFCDECCPLSLQCNDKCDVESCAEKFTQWVNDNV